MMKKMTFFLAAVLALPLGAQTVTPSAEQMIEQLKAPRTRSLRNLTVEAAPAPGQEAAAATPGAVAAPTAAPAPRPSLSLQIQFDFNSASIRPESQQALVNLVQLMLQFLMLAIFFQLVQESMLLYHHLVNLRIVPAQLLEAGFLRLGHLAPEVTLNCIQQYHLFHF